MWQLCRSFRSFGRLRSPLIGAKLPGRLRRCMSSAVLNLRPTPESQRQWFDVVEKSPSAPRSVIIDTFTQPSYSSCRGTDWGIEGVDYEFRGPDEDFYRALACLHRLPNVSEVALRFTSDCFGAETEREKPMHFDCWGIEDSKRRAMMLDAFFQATAEHCRSPGNQRLESLTVRNLQNTTYECATASDDFRETIKHLKALHLQIITEYDGLAFRKEEMKTFWPHLRSRWLEPLADQLDTLTLYWDTRWGIYPPMGLHELHFPKLRSLLLGTYVFGTDDQFQWLFSHKSLRYLSLDACDICSDWRIPDPDEHHFNDELRVAKATLPVAFPFNPDIPFNDPGSMWDFKYPTRWPAIFDRLPKELPELRDFRFGDNWDPFGDESSKCEPRQDTRFEDRYALGTKYKSSPYVSFFPLIGGDGFEGEPICTVYGRETSETDSLMENEERALETLVEQLRERRSSEAPLGSDPTTTRSNVDG